MKVGSLFSGIGGLELGLERAGMEVVWQCEIDKAAQSVLRRRFPNATIYDDVTTLGRDVESVDLICGGFPCQDLSVAGRRAGLAGERSGLWYQFHRILGELAPRWVLVENVPGLLSSNGGRDFAVVLRGLVELGYGVAWRILDAQYFGVAQRRRRVFIVGCLGDRRGAAEVLFEPESLPGHPTPRREAGERVAALTSCGVGTCGADDNQAQDGHLVAQFDGHSANGIQERVGVANTLDGDGRDDVIVTHALTSEGHDASEDGTGRGVPLVMAPAFSKRPGQQIATRQDGLSFALTAGDPRRITSPIAFDWQQDACTRTQAVAFEPGSVARSAGPAGESPQCPTLRSNMGDNKPAVRMGMSVRRLTPTECERLQGFPDGWTDGQSDSARYRQLGNAVCVNVAEWIGRRILDLARRSP